MLETPGPPPDLAHMTPPPSDAPTQQPSPTPRITGVQFGVTWAGFLGACLFLSGLGLFFALIGGSALSSPLAIVFGSCLISLTLLEQVTR